MKGDARSMPIGLTVNGSSSNCCTAFVEIPFLSLYNKTVHSFEENGDLFLIANAKCFKQI